MSQTPAKTIQQMLDEMLTTAGSGTTYSPGLALPSGITWSALTGGLTEDERKELQELKSNYNIKVKSAKIAEFKKLPPELRQFIMNFISWQLAVDVINNASVEKDQRMVELENKNNSPFSMGITLSDAIYYSGGVNISLPKDLDTNDLKNAHTEATIEEQMLDSDPNGNTSDVVE